MALLLQMMRAGAITGDTRYVNAWFADRQGRAWAERTVRAAMPRPHARRPPPDPDATRRGLEDLHARGVLSDAELAQLRARLGV